jgi:4-diphosphocytidyl-2-C-methyl-D-erythritol kinase
MISFPNGKINIGLSVLEKRPDGYHNIETIMYPVSIHDVLEIIVFPGIDFSFSLTGINIPGETGNNLVCKAYELLKKDFNIPAIKIHLHKVIPAGAGLGGGSADAAFAIKMINKLFDLGLSEEKMEYYSKILGSDCAFFIKNKPVIAYEKGDKFENVALNLEKYFLIIVKPYIHINTQEAYSWIKPARKEISLKDLVHAPINQWKNTVINDFEAELIKQHPVIEIIIKRLYEVGAIFASLTGSGAAVYGIFSEVKDIQKEFPRCFFWSNQ